jgi:hypothetical protein
VRAALPARERDDLTLGQLPPPGPRPERRPAANDDQELLVPQVVVEVPALSRREFVEADPEAFAASLVADPSTAERFGVTVEVGSEDVRHP